MDALPALTTGRRLIELLAPQPGESVLDVGCGLGGLTVELTLSGAKVTGLDHSPVLLEQARLQPGIEWVLADFRFAEPTRPYDAIFSHAALHWMGGHAEIALRLHRWLRPGGRLAVSFGGLTPALAMMESGLPTAAEFDLSLRAAGLVATRLIEEPGLLLVTARRPA